MLACHQLKCLLHYTNLFVAVIMNHLFLITAPVGTLTVLSHDSRIISPVAEISGFGHSLQNATYLPQFWSHFQQFCEQNKGNDQVTDIIRNVTHKC